jgi:hypothetical protein
MIAKILDLGDDNILDSKILCIDLLSSKHLNIQEI